MKDDAEVDGFARMWPTSHSQGGGWYQEAFQTRIGRHLNEK